MGAGRNWGEEIAERFDPPPETLAQVPRVTLSGNRRVVVENHRGLLAYSNEMIEVAGGRLRVRIVGDGLCLRAMDAATLLVTGKIQSLELEEGTLR